MLERLRAFIDLAKDSRILLTFWDSRQQYSHVRGVAFLKYLIEIDFHK